MRETNPPPSLTGINHITLGVTDLERSFHFYRNILGMQPLVKWDRGAYFLVGNFWFCLSQEKKESLSLRKDYTHYALSVAPQDFKTFEHKLRQENIPLFQENTSPGHSVYFLDPDGHQLEIHIGNWQDRIQEKKKNGGSWKNVIWYV